jgi:hypothetical protein
LQGFRVEQLADLSKAAVVRTLGNAMSVPVVASVFKRCMEVLVARLGTAAVPHAIAPPLDKERETRRRASIGLMRERIALLEAQEAVLRRMDGHE